MGQCVQASVWMSVVLAAGAAWGQGAATNYAQPEAQATKQAAPTLSDMLGALSADEQLYHQHLVTLTNPWLEGRAPGSRGNALSVEYVEWWFKQYGLEPAFPAAAEAGGAEGSTQRSFRQAFPAGRRPVVNAERVSARGADGAEWVLKPGTDFNLRGTTGSGQVTGPLVFVGYAIADGPDGYSTFAEKDTLEGKIALVLRFEPLDEAGKSKWGEGGGFSAKAGLNEKIAAVMQRKPAAVILVAPPGVDDPRGTQLETMAGTSGRREQPVPFISMSVEAADRLVKMAGGESLLALRKEADQRGFIRDLAGAMLSLDVQVTREQQMAENIGGIIRGRGALAEQFIVLGAHMDHIGYGAFGSRGGAAAMGKLHPGADDNASGTAGLLLAAKRLRAQYDALPPDANVRSVMFLAFNAEEGGLIGSRYYIGHAPIPAERTTAMLNMDMIGRVRNGRLEVSGVGSAEGWAEWLKESWDRAGQSEGTKLTVRTLPGGSGPSDHASFYRAGIPVLHFFTGLHADYHLPADLYPTVNTPGAVAVVGTVLDVVTRLASRVEPLEFKRSSGPSIDMAINRDDPRARAAEPTPASAPVPAPTPAPAADPHGGAAPGAAPAPGGVGMGGSRVRFGIAPGDYTGEGGGVEVGEVFPGTSAAEAGLKAGDKMMSWNGKPTPTVEDWMPLLTGAKPGDVVEIVLRRGGETLTVKATLKARGGNE
jgi:hypothetical protein